MVDISMHNQQNMSFQRCYVTTHCAGHILANTSPHQRCAEDTCGGLLSHVDNSENHDEEESWGGGIGEKREEGRKEYIILHGSLRAL